MLIEVVASTLALSGCGRINPAFALGGSDTDSGTGTGTGGASRTSGDPSTQTASQSGSGTTTDQSGSQSDSDSLSNSGSLSNTDSKGTGDTTSGSTSLLASSTGDESTTMSDETDGCPPPLAKCRNMCVDQRTNEQHCGVCNLPCGDNQFCENGSCQAQTRIAFVSSQPLPVMSEGIGAANQLCAGLANAAGLPGTYRAWMSDENTEPASELPPGVRWVSPMGFVLAEDTSDLFSGALGNPLAVDENGDLYSADELQCEEIAAVWTGTDAAGLATGVDCDNWASSSPEIIGTVGDAFSTDSTWTSAECEVGCDIELPVYCFQVE